VEKEEKALASNSDYPYIPRSENDKDLAALAEASDSDGSTKVSFPNPDLVLAPT